MKNIFDFLTERGFIDEVTSDEIREYVEKPVTIYVGFDPTADSLHIGNMVGIMALAWFQRFGHKIVALVGGATGMIGDPSGKSIERNLLDVPALEHNLKGIRRSLETILDLDSGLLLNNHEWFKEYGYIDFLRDIGKNFRMGPMLAKEAVRSRMNSEEGLSYTEFSYQLLQAYDFLYLSDKYDATFQMGGSDQWGNITAGTELVRKMRGKTVHGLTWPLLTRSDGKKFGKTEGGTIWLNSDRLLPYDFYQYLYRTLDTDVCKLMRILTFVELEEIREIENQMKAKDYIPNTAQKRLAQEVTRIVHGKAGVEEAERITAAAAPGAKTTLDTNTLEALALEIPSKTFPHAEIIQMDVVDLFVKAAMLSSKSEARRLITSGGAYLNNEKIGEENLILKDDHFIEGRFLLLGVGKKKKMVIRIEK
ncbi:MAG: Tyrosine--tRNA ligase [Chlamydiae bacterium]|nr:Tyrosine--tRNA ligase [Chlamydiota bacterium]